MPRKVIKEIKTLHKAKFLSLYEALYTRKDGNEGKWLIASRKSETDLNKMYFENKSAINTDAVVIIAFHKEEKKLAVIKQFRIPINDYIYELPAGLIDNNESLEKAGIRELKEETGLIVTKVLKSEDRLYVSPGMTEESVGLLYCLCEGELSTDFIETDEEIIPFLLSKEEVKELLKNPITLDIKAYFILSQFVLGNFDDIF